MDRDEHGIVCVGSGMGGLSAALRMTAQHGEITMIRYDYTGSPW